PAEAEYKAVLKELGSPEKLALEYGRSDRHLIGPRWYDMYFKLLKQLLLIVPPIIAVIAGIAHFAESKVIMESIISGIGAALETGVHIAFWTTLTFAVFEYMGVKPESMASEWSLDDLPELSSPRQIPVADSIAGMVMSMVFAAVVVYAVSLPALWTQQAHSTLNPELWQGWVQGFLALSAASLVLEFAKYKIGNWTTALAVANVLLCAVWAAFISFVILTQDVVNPALITEAQAKAGETNLQEVLDWTLGISVVVTILSCIWSAGDSIYKAVILRRG
ncbi:MAG TPA: hypothetical protein VFZ62_04905, partial [Candidatus Saccharimonadales bacterium]